MYNHNISYVKPAKVGEWVRIMSRVLWHNNNTAVIEYYMTDDARKELKNLMWTTLKYVTIAEGKLTDHQGAVVDYLKATSMQMDISEMTITQRVKAIKEHLRKV